MIYLYTGTPGSGKSYHLAYDIYYKLKRGGQVIANFNINLNIFKNKNFKFTFVDNNSISPFWLFDYARKYLIPGKENQVLLCIDEAQVIFNCRTFSSKDRLDWITFFSQHRKLGYNVILISQTDRMLDRQIRTLVEYETKHRKLNNYKFFKILPITIFACVDYWYGISERLSCNFLRYRKKIAKLYDTFYLFGSTSATRGDGVPSEMRGRVPSNTLPMFQN